MKNYLIFQLYSPIAAWGDIAVGEERPDITFPTKSAILGFLGAAMGVKRDEELVHQKMADNYGVACRIETSGLLLRDYHTVQMPSQDKNIRYFTRKDELASPRNKLNTLLSYREYQMDAIYTAGVWQQWDQSPFSLEELTRGLQYPKYTLYLGRKSCPPALPLQTQIISQVENVRIAFRKAQFSDEILKPVFSSNKHFKPIFYWEYDSHAPKAQRLLVRDYPSSRRRWQFKERVVQISLWNEEGE